MRGRTQHLQKNLLRLSPFEWMVVLGIPFIMIFTIRYLMLFYIGLSIIVLISSYALAAVWDFTRKKNRLHYLPTLRYGLIAILAAFLYLSL